MHKNDNFDEDETIILKDSSDNVVYKVDKDDNIFDANDNDVTSTTEDKLFFNKIYTEQADVEKFTINNTQSLTEQEILNYFIKIYNYVYGEFRDMLTEGSSVETLVGLNSEHLMYNFDETNEKSSGLATFLFDTISVNNEVPYNASPKSISTGGTSYYHLAYKLSEPDKTDLETTVLDLLESAIVLPEVVVTDFELPTNGEYGATITWVSADKEVISNTGQVTTPDEASIVDMQYTIKALGKTRTGTISVSVILTGENDTVTEPNITYPELSTLISEEIYDELLEKLANDKITGSNASQNINTKLAELRSDLEFEIFDYYLTLDYKEIDSNYDLTNKGNKTIIAKIKTSADSEFIEFTADDVFEYTMEKNPAVYVIYAGQFKEMLYSEYYEAVFGSEMNLKQNSTDEMENMYQQVTNAKSNYSYYQQLYAQYGLEYPYETFNDFSYVQYGTKTELELLQYFVSRRLQPYYIQMLIEEVKATELIYPTIEDNFDNFFSLNVEQLLIYIDFDEDGRPDDFNEYLDGLTTIEKDDFNTLIASLEQNIEDYNEEASSTYTKLVTEFKNASFEDEDWGTYKKHGIYLKQESLNIADEEEEGVYHSLNYSGEYGVKDSYVKEFTDKLISMYQEYILPQNITLKELDNSGDLLKTEFGLHLILATKGDDFTGISAKFTEADNNGVEYSNDSYNDEDLPSIEQLELYTLYKFYEMTYDLSDADIEEKEGIEVPDIPKSVIEAIDFYLAGSLDDFYVMGSVNIKIAEFLSLGRFLENDLVNLTNAELLAKLDEAKDVYYDAVVGKYTE
jgi:hypothetical protein